MKAYGMFEVNNHGWLDVEQPVAGPLDAILRPLYVAPCSSDTHVMHGGIGPVTNRVLGHEAVGEVVEVGSAVTKFKPGDIVVVPCVTPDWAGAPEAQREVRNPHDLGLMGSFKFVTQKDGVFGEFFHVNSADANLVLLPNDVDPYAALMTVDMMSTGFVASELCDIQYGDNVAVFGIGPIGLMAVRAAVIGGAGKVIGIGTRPNCVKIAKEYGATDIVSYKEGDVVEQIIEITNGGADKIMIAGGGGESISQAVKAAVPGAVISSVNFYDPTDKLEIPAMEWGLGMSNIDIRCGFCVGGAKRIENMLNLISNKRIDPSLLITHKYEGFDKIEDAFIVMDEKPKDLIKPAVKINW